MGAMDSFLNDIRNNATLVIAVAVTTTLGTLLIRKLLGGSGGRRTFSPGSGPTGKGKWKLYHSATLRSARCLWLIEEMNALEDFEIVEYDPYSASPQEKDDYKRHVHPHGLVPAMVTSEGDVMIESAAICMHLAELYGKCLPDERNQALYYNWCINASATADSPLDVVYDQLYKIDEKDKDPKKIEAATYKCLEWLSSLEKLLNNRTKKNKFICSNGFTAADTIIGYSVFFASLNKGGILLRDCPNVQEYLVTLKARPLWKKCMGTARDWLTLTQPDPDRQ